MLALLSATSAQALELDWQAPAGCPDVATVKRNVQRLAGAAEGASLVARAVVTQTTAQRWRVSIDLSGSATGHRSLTADTCPQLARASALIIALAANPEAALDLPSDEQPAASPPSSTTQPSRSTPKTSTAPESPVHQDQGTEPEREKPSSPSPPQTHAQKEPASVVVEPEPMDADRSTHRPESGLPRSDHGIDVFARIGFERGALPTDTGWLGVGVRLRSSKLPLSFSLATYATQGTSATFTNGIGSDFRLLAGQALLCLQPNTHHWFIAGCGGAQVSLTRAAGFIHPVPGNQSTAGGEFFVRYRWTPAPLFALALGYELFSPLTAEFGGGIALPLTRWQFVVENVGLLAQPERQQMFLYAGLGVRL